VILAVIVEVQLTADPDKCWAWPVYWAGLRARHRCPVILLVVVVDPPVAEWARRVVADTAPNVQFTPLILGPSAVPWITELDEAERSPELAVLSALVHGNEPGGAEVALTATAAVARLDAPRVTLYHDLIQHSLSEAARATLEALMDLKGYEWKSDFAKKHRAEGRAEGIAEGVAKGRAEALVAFLRARGLEMTDAQRVRVLACNDLAVLDAWIARAALASSVDEVLS